MKHEREAFHPSVESIQIVASAAAGISPDDLRLVEWHNDYVAHHTARIAFDLDLVRKTARDGSSILEFGSIPLLLTAALSQLNYRVTGCDISPERYATSISRLGTTVTKCDIEREPLPFAGGSFDVVIFNELFEHLRINPIFTLSEAFRVMKPNGLLMMSTPNLRSLSGIRNFLLRNKSYSCSGNIFAEYDKLESLGHMGHVREYTTTEVIEFLGQIGFAVKSVVYRGSYDRKAADIVLRALPALRPFVSYIAAKPSGI